MNLEDQVCSLELAKRLKELGVNSSSLFYWVSKKVTLSGKDVRCFSIEYIHWFDDLADSDSLNNYEYYPAYSVAEIGHMFPQNCPPLQYWMAKISTSNMDSLWQGDIVYAGKSAKIFNAEKEADLRAEMLIFLIENKLYEPK